MPLNKKITDFDQLTATDVTADGQLLEIVFDVGGAEENKSLTPGVLIGAYQTADSKTTPIDADLLPLVDTADGNVIKKLTWANLKATLRASDFGYLGIPQNAQNGDYTLVLSDAGKEIYYAGGGGHTYEIPDNTSVAFPVGTVIVISNGSAFDLAVAPDTDTLIESPGNGGHPLISQYGSIVLTKKTSTVWWYTGGGYST